MGWEKLQIDARDFLSCALKEPFQLLTITLLSLLLPLSFLLLARLSCAHYLFNVASYHFPQSSSFLISFFYNTNPLLLYLLISIISVATLIHGLKGKITLLSQAPAPILRSRLYLAWIILCTLQVCVGLGIEGSIAAGVDGFSFGTNTSLLSRAVSFLGLHEIMLHWSRMVVKPVVDDTVFGATREERWVERAAMAMSFGSLWWWRLRDEVESMVVVAEVKRELSMPLEMTDLVAWWLYYLTATIGMVRVVKGAMWAVTVLLCRGRRTNPGETSGIEDKV